MGMGRGEGEESLTSLWVELAGSRSAWYNVKIAMKHNVKQNEEEGRHDATYKVRKI